MAFDTATPQPVQPNPSAAPAPAPAPDITTAPNPDLMQGISGMSQPGNQPTMMGSVEGQGYTAAVGQEQQALKDAQTAANQPIIPASTPHSRLLNIISVTLLISFIL